MIKIIDSSLFVVIISAILDIRYINFETPINILSSILSILVLLF
jgi:hypothetical protein